jgi:hypothetical protein
LIKNTADQKWRVFAFTTATQAPLEGAAATITATIVKNHGSPVATNDVNPTEDVDGGGYYWFDLTQEETNADHLALSPVCSTAGVIVLADSSQYYTTSG